MLAIRMQRTGRKGHAQFRVVVQESRFTPSSGRVVANIGNYDPHTKVAAVDKQKADFYLTNGAQPSERAARLLQSQGVTLPSWVKLTEQKERKTRNPEKLRSNQPPAPAAPVEETPHAVADVPVDPTPTEESVVAVAPVEAAPNEQAAISDAPQAATVDSSETTEASTEATETEPEAKTEK